MREREREREGAGECACVCVLESVGACGEVRECVCARARVCVLD